MPACVGQGGTIQVSGSGLQYKQNLAPDATRSTEFTITGTFKVDSEARGLARGLTQLCVRDLGADFNDCVSVRSAGDSIPFMPVTTMTEESCARVNQLWLKAGLTKAPPTYVPVSGPKSVGMPSAQSQRMSVTGSVESTYANRGKPSASKSVDTRAVALFSAVCVNDTQRSCEQIEAALYERVQRGLTGGIMYLEERSRVSVMLEELGELVDVLRQNVRASTNT